MKIEKRLKQMNDKLNTILSIMGDSKSNEVVESDTKELLCDKVKKRTHIHLKPEQKKALKKDSKKLDVEQLIEKYGVSRTTVRRIIND